MYSIETKRLGLRNWKETDIPLFIEMNRDNRVMEFFPTLLSAEESMAMIERTKKFIAENQFGLWAVEIKGIHEFIRYTGLARPRFKTDFTPCVEIGWRLANKYWGNGFATEAAHTSIDYGFHVIKLDEILSFTSVLNVRSINVMKKIGMGFVKKFSHPNIEEGHRLKEHLLYKKIPQPKI